MRLLYPRARRESTFCLFIGSMCSCRSGHRRRRGSRGVMRDLRGEWEQPQPEVKP